MLKNQWNDVRWYAFLGGRKFVSFQTGVLVYEFSEYGLDKWHSTRYSARMNFLRVQVINRSSNCNRSLRTLSGFLATSTVYDGRDGRKNQIKINTYRKGVFVLRKTIEIGCVYSGYDPSRTFYEQYGTTIGVVELRVTMSHPKIQYLSRSFVPAANGAINRECVRVRCTDHGYGVYDVHDMTYTDRTIPANFGPEFEFIVNGRERIVTLGRVWNFENIKLPYVDMKNKVKSLLIIALVSQTVPFTILQAVVTTVRDEKIEFIDFDIHWPTSTRNSNDEFFIFSILNGNFYL